MTTKHQLSDEEMDQQDREEIRERNRQLGIEETLEYIREYGDLFLLEDEDVTQSVAHVAAIRYLVPLLQWLYNGQNVAVAEDLRMYRPGDEASIAGPDIAIIDGLITDTSSSQKAYGVGLDGPSPRVVFEIASASTWNKDLTTKLDKYARLGVKEYFVCDPNPEQVWQGEWLNYGRLAGWKLNLRTGYYEPLQIDEQSRLQSEELQSWLRVDGDASEGRQRFWLNLYDLQGQLRLNEAQVRTQQAEDERLRAEQAEDALLAERQRVQELEALLKQLKQP